MMERIEHGVERAHVVYGGSSSGRSTTARRCWRSRSRSSSAASSCCRWWAPSSCPRATRAALVPHHDAGGLEPRLHRRQGAPGRGSRAHLPRGRDDRGQRRHRRRPQRRARGSAPRRNATSARTCRVKEFEKKVRDKIRAIPGIELAVGYNRPIWINLLGPVARRARATSPTRSSRRWRRSRASPTSESSLKAPTPRSP